MRLIYIEDGFDSEYGLEFVIPESMSTEDAVKIVDTTVEKVHQKENYIYADLEAVLIPLGFTKPEYVMATSVW